MAENGVGKLGGTGTFGRRLLLAVDAKDYGCVDTSTQRQIQETISRLLAEAADVARLDRSRWVTQEGGDSVFAVLPEGASEPNLVDTFMRTLDAGLRTFNRGRKREAWLRLRAAVHFGSSSPGANGFVGRGPVEIGRILDSAALRTTLTAAPDACLAVGVSATVFHDVVEEDAYITVRADEFREVLVEEKEYRGQAWIWVPGAGVRHDCPGPDSRTPPREGGDPAASHGDPWPVGRQPSTQTNVVYGNGTQFAVQHGNVVYHQAPGHPPTPGASGHNRPA